MNFTYAELTEMKIALGATSLENEDFLSAYHKIEKARQIAVLQAVVDSNIHLIQEEVMEKLGEPADTDLETLLTMAINYLKK